MLSDSQGEMVCKKGRYTSYNNYAAMSAITVHMLWWVVELSKV